MGTTFRTTFRTTTNKGKSNLVPTQCYGWSCEALSAISMVDTVYLLELSSVRGTREVVGCSTGYPMHIIVFRGKNLIKKKLN